MSEKAWGAVDAYIEASLLADADPIFGQVLRANAAGGLPAIDVSPAQGKFLSLLVAISGARNILEIGTLGAYSTIWMARALPQDGRLLSLEFSERHAAVARDNLARAGLLEQVEVRVGAALDSLPQVEADGLGPFDLIFIDADKPNNPGYLDWALRLSRTGTVIVLDNVVRDGRVVDAASDDRNVKGARAAFELLKAHPRIDATALQTVGAKGWDGFILGLVR
ncbi:MAG: methyltransferase [Devosia sp. 67-54]|uniref:O-methyltransferase n=1 Tax=unclassified Devosia TaxID=196773 RepID=UPI00096427E9|nr:MULTISPECIES: O-methyltransferase [unclassified Devosia]MBN9306235.1 O-methyltransferase [Devosia sp.]OJX18311.1 MAG: methyltransferase [Devosia sp. 67-54]